MIVRTLVFTAVFVASFALRAQAAPLPQTIAAPAPFPLVTWTGMQSEFVAPGVVRGDYHLLTASGPLHVTVVAADLHHPNLRLGAVLASDQLISHGETISSMAARTGAIAGINADYFDIGQTNQPLGILVQRGQLMQPPSTRATISVLDDGTIRFGKYRLTGDGTTDPPLDGVVTALGGGPLLIADGRAVTDPDAPATDETNLRFPVAGIASESDGTLLLIAVDGRLPRVSIGLTRPELGALMLALGGRDGMATDSGGSATLVARELGERNPSVLNSPSDGMERPVADGLFIYSDLPLGAAARLVVRPSSIRALPGVRVALRGAITDAAGNLLDDDRVAPATITVPLHAGSSVAEIARNGLVASVPIEVVPHLDGLRISPLRPNPDPAGTVDLFATGFDAHAQPIALGDRVVWSATSGAIDAAGRFRAGLRDAVVSASAGGLTQRVTVRVGRHVAPVNLFGEGATKWRFVTVPANGPGRLDPIAACRCLELHYDFTGNERAAYAAQEIVLPESAVGFALDVQGDGKGAALRATLTDRDGRMLRVTLARTIDWSGWRHLDAHIPDDLTPPVRLVSLYAVGTLGDTPLHAAGTLAFRRAALSIAGTP